VNIDRSLVAEMVERPRATWIFHAIVGLARPLRSGLLRVSRAETGRANNCRNSAASRPGVFFSGALVAGERRQVAFRLLRCRSGGRDSRAEIDPDHPSPAFLPATGLGQERPAGEELRERDWIVSARRAAFRSRLVFGANSLRQASSTMDLRDWPSGSFTLFA